MGKISNIQSNLVSPLVETKEIKKPKYLTNLKTKTVGDLITTNDLKQKAESILSPRVKNQIDALGVKSRYLASLGHKSITESCQNLVEETMGEFEISNLVVASEISDYQTPGLAPLLVNSTGNNFVNVFNLQGTACSSLPKTLKLCENLEGNTMVLICGITSPIYQKTFEDLIKQSTTVQSGSEDWVALMFSFLFGDGISSFIHSDKAASKDDYGIRHLGQVTNLNPEDFKAAYVDKNLYPHASKNIPNLALQYSDKLLKKLEISDLSDYDKIILHTGSQKIIDAFQERYSLEESQVKDSRFVLENYGNLTGCSLPFVLDNSSEFEKALMIGISMGASLDMVEVYRSN